MPSVRGPGRIASNWVGDLALAAATLAGSISIAIIVWLASTLWRPTVVMIMILAIILACGRLLRPFNVGMGGFKVPRDLITLGRTRYLATFGFLMGLGVITTMPSPVMLLMIGWAWHLGMLWWIAGTFAAFGTGRIAGSFAYRLRTSSAVPAEAASSAAQFYSYLGFADAVICIGLACSFIPRLT